MSSETDPRDKPHDPTPKKLEDARKKGELARSAELNTAFMYLGLLLSAVTLGGTAMIKAGDGLAVFLARADALAVPDGVAISHGLPNELFQQILTALLPWFVAPGVLVLMSVAVQRNLVFAPEKLKFKLSRISPVSNFKNKFGMNGLFEFFKSSVKLAIYSVILTIFLLSEKDQIISAVTVSPQQGIIMWLRLCLYLLVFVLLTAAAIAGLDVLWQRHAHLRQHRMSDQELKDEFKESEGDPTFKSARRAKAQEIAMNKMMHDVAQSDVVIVNPTHYAVALKWDRSRGGAPICVAKGVDETAARIRERATLSGIPIFSDPPTARKLHADIRIDQEILPEHYRAVAAAIRFAEKMREKKRQGWT